MYTAQGVERDNNAVLRAHFGAWAWYKKIHIIVITTVILLACIGAWFKNTGI
jgi:hypothetical protein